MEVSSYGAASAFKFGITKNSGDAEPLFAVYTMDASKSFDNRRFLAIV